MRDILLAIVLLIFIGLGFPVMRRVDRFLNENLRQEKDRPETKTCRTGKQNKTVL